MSLPFDVTSRFDGAAHWAALDEADRNAIGAAALEWLASEAMAQRGYEEGDPVWSRAADAAAAACVSALQEAFVDAIPREALEAPSGAPRIPSLLGMVCAACGCSHDDACPEGCGWAEDSLCTACGGARAAEVAA